MEDERELVFVIAGKDGATGVVPLRQLLYFHSTPKDSDGDGKGIVSIADGESNWLSFAKPYRFAVCPGGEVGGRVLDMRKELQKDG